MDRLSIARVGTASVVSHAYATPPLRLLIPDNHGDAIWCFTSHLGGGFVDRDAIGLDVDVAPGASLWLTTQSSTKIYRSPGGTEQQLRARAGAGARLAIVPDPIVCFRDARHTQR